MKRNDRSEEIFDFMQKFIAENGREPNETEIAEMERPGKPRKAVAAVLRDW